MAATIISFEGQGFTDVPTILSDIIPKLIANGFTQVFPIGANLTYPLVAGSIVTLEFGPTIDPLNAPVSPLVAQPYRIRFEIDNTGKKLHIHIATPIQLPDDGTLATYQKTQQITYQSGLVGQQMLSSSQPAQHFISRSDYTTQADADAWPMHYKMSISDHGFALAIWEPGNDVNIDRMSWFVVQRSVSNVDGHVVGTDSAIKKAPVFCVWHIKRSPAVVSTQEPALDITQKFVVRELDIDRPTESVDATNDGDDWLRSIPTTTLVSILETGSYNVTFVGSLNTQRFTYPQDELDMIAWTSSDVISTGLTAAFTAYGEATTRNYKALPSSNGNNTNVRILMYDSHN